MKTVLGLLTFEAVLAGLLFGCAGRVDLPWFWALLGVHAMMMMTGALVIDPGLKKERLRPGGGGLDRGFRPVLAVLAVAHLIVAGLDVRFGWSPQVPAAARAVALGA